MNNARYNIMQQIVRNHEDMGCERSDSGIRYLQAPKDYDMLNVAISPLIDSGNECKQSKHTLNFELGKGRVSQGW